MFGVNDLSDSQPVQWMQPKPVLATAVTLLNLAHMSCLEL